MPIQKILDAGKLAASGRDKSTEPSARDEAEALFQQALELQGRWELKRAEDLLEKAVELEPAHDASYIQLGYIRLKQQLFEEALHFFNTAYEMNPSANALIGIGYYHYERKQFSEAAAQFRRSLELDPLNSNAHLALGKALAQSEQSMEAFQEFEKALSVFPPCAEHVYVERGAIFRKYRLLRDAAREFQSAVEANPFNLYARLSLAECHDWMEERKPALSHYKLLMHLTTDAQMLDTIRERIANIESRMK